MPIFLYPDRGLMETTNAERIFDKVVLIMKRWLKMQMLKNGICPNPLTESNSQALVP